MASAAMARHRAAATGEKKTHTHTQSFASMLCAVGEVLSQASVCVPLPSPGKTGNGSLPVVEKGAIKFYEGP